MCCVSVMQGLVESVEDGGWEGDKGSPFFITPNYVQPDELLNHMPGLPTSPV